MKKLFFALFLAVTLAACGAFGPVYNTQLKQVELGMTQREIVTLMGDKYNVVDQRNNGDQTLEYVDKYKNHWFFVFVNGQLNKWYKETEN
ncbi:MAG: hypothetical protein ACK5KL_13570 [Dysgonomonas sp.]|jgi:hypothetical protein|nr:hypothetical protein [Prevotella sp.]MDR3056796.1 hypothetical protein [Prevotella sp.]